MKKRQVEAQKEPLEILTPLTQEEQRLWGAYRRAPCDRTRNALATYYAGWVEGKAKEMARRFNVDDVDDFVGQMLLLLNSRFIPACRNQSTFHAMLAVSIHHQCVSFVQRKRAASMDEAHKDLLVDHRTKRDSDGLESSELMFIVNHLSNDLWQVIWLHYFQHLKIREIAEHLGIPQGSVKRRLYLARNELRKHLVR